MLAASLTLFKKIKTFSLLSYGDVTNNSVHHIAHILHHSAKQPFLPIIYPYQLLYHQLCIKHQSFNIRHFRGWKWPLYRSQYCCLCHLRGWNFQLQNYLCHLWGIKSRSNKKTSTEKLPPQPRNIPHQLPVLPHLLCHRASHHPHNNGTIFFTLSAQHFFAQRMFSVPSDFHVYNKHIWK